MNVTMASIFMLVTATSLNSPNLINNYINEIDYKQFKTELQNKNCNVLSSNTIQYSFRHERFKKRIFLINKFLIRYSLEDLNEKANCYY